MVNKPGAADASPPYAFCVLPPPGDCPWTCRCAVPTWVRARIGGDFCCQVLQEGCERAYFASVRVPSVLRGHGGAGSLVCVPGTSPGTRACLSIFVMGWRRWWLVGVGQGGLAEVGRAACAYGCSRSAA